MNLLRPCPWPAVPFLHLFLPAPLSEPSLSPLPWTGTPTLGPGSKAFSGFSPVRPPQLIPGGRGTPPHCWLCSAPPCFSPGVWLQPGLQEAVPAVCHLRSAEPLTPQGCVCAALSAGRSLSFAPSSLPSPAQMCPLPWSNPLWPLSG